MDNNKNKLDRVTPAKFSKRFFGFLIDSVIVTIVTVIIYFSFSSNFLYDKLGGKDSMDSYINYCIDSNLCLVTKSDTVSKSKKIAPLIYSPSENEETGQKQPGYVLYLEKISDFYVDFLPKHEHVDDVGNKKASEFYTINYFNTEVMGLPVIEDTTYKKGVSKIADRRNYFQYKVDKDTNTILVNEKPVLTEYAQNLVNNGSVEMKTELNEYFFKNINSKPDPNCIYYKALQVLNNQSYAKDLLAKHAQVEYICTLVTILPAVIIFFFIIPLCTPNGETIGKLILSCGVCSTNGYKISWYSRIIRPLYMTILVSLPYVFPKNIAKYVSIVAFTLLLADFIVMSLDKTSNNKSLHDRLAKTMVYDKKNSKIFKNEHEEELFNKEHKQKSTKTSNKQEGSLTIDDNELLCKIEKENSIIDLETLKKHQEIIDSIESFDEFENR